MWSIENESERVFGWNGWTVHVCCSVQHCRHFFNVIARILLASLLSSLGIPHFFSATGRFPIWYAIAYTRCFCYTIRFASLALFSSNDAFRLPLHCIRLLVFCFLCLFMLRDYEMFMRVDHLSGIIRKQGGNQRTRKRSIKSMQLIFA